MNRRALVHCTLAVFAAVIFAGLLPTGAESRAGSSSPECQLPAQQPVVSGNPTVFRVSSNLVMVPVSVTDTNGKPVNDLQANDFKLREDDRPESIATLAEPGQTSLHLALLFDISGSVSPRFEFQQKAAADFLERVYREGDTISIVAVAAEPRIVQPATRNLQTALDALHSLQPTRNMTAFFDSVVEATRLLRKSTAPDARRVEVVLSDGEDNNSQQYQIADALLEVQRGDCIFYAINPAGPSIRLNQLSLRGQKAMESLAEETGGWVFLPEGLSELQAIFNRISAELRAQYLLEYYSSNTRTDGAFRHIVVTIPGRPDLRVRARQGYYAPMG